MMNCRKIICIGIGSSQCQGTRGIFFLNYVDTEKIMHGKFEICVEDMNSLVLIIREAFKALFLGIPGVPYPILSLPHT